MATQPVAGSKPALSGHAAPAQPTQPAKGTMRFNPPEFSGVDSHTIYPPKRDGTRSVMAFSARLPIRTVGGGEIKILIRGYLNEIKSADGGITSYRPALSWPRDNPATEDVKADALAYVTGAAKAWSGFALATSRAKLALMGKLAKASKGADGKSSAFDDLPVEDGSVEGPAGTGSTDGAAGS